MFAKHLSGKKKKKLVAKLYKALLKLNKKQITQFKNRQKSGHPTKEYIQMVNKDI